MGQHDALRPAGAAGGELQQGHVRGFRSAGAAAFSRGRARLLAAPAAPLLPVRHRRLPPQPQDLRPQQPRGGHHLREGDQGHRLRGGEDARLPPQVILDLAAPRRRVERHRHRAREQRAEERREVVVAAGQHQRHRLPALDAGGPQPGRHPPRAPQQVAVGQLPRRSVTGVEHQVPPPRMPVGVPQQDLDQRPRPLRRRLGRALEGRRLGRRRSGGRCRPGHRRPRRPRHPLHAGRRQRARQVRRRLGAAQHLFRQPHRERPLEPRHQLRPPQAVEPEVALERRPHVDPLRRRLHLARTHLARHLPRQAQQLVLHGRGRRRPHATIFSPLTAARPRGHSAGSPAPGALSRSRCRGAVQPPPPPPPPPAAPSRSSCTAAAARTA